MKIPLPTITVASGPSAPAFAGSLRYNPIKNCYELFDGTTWVVLSSSTTKDYRRIKKWKS